MSSSVPLWDQASANRTVLFILSSPVDSLELAQQTSSKPFSPKITVLFCIQLLLYNLEIKVAFEQ